jgi:KipI family sensor histidine kinase inhibitor
MITTQPGHAAQDKATSLPRILPAGDQALVVEYGDTISPLVHDRVLALDAAVSEAAIAGVTETVPTYRSLMVCHDPSVIRGRDLAQRLLGLVQACQPIGVARRLWHVPVLYGGEAALDLDDLARARGLTTGEVAALHRSADYRIYMNGFLPGFTYLGGLPAVLHTPRRAVPRQITPAGGIAIGGAQACVGALPSPSGWHFLGRTPLRSFDPARTQPFVFSPGEMVRFHEVSLSEAERLDGMSARGAVCAEWETCA